MSQVVHKLKYADPFLPLFDYLLPKNKKLIWNADIAKHLEKDRSKYRFIGFHGGRGSGKSYHFALALLNIARVEKILVLCCREIQNTIKDSVHRILKTLINKYGLSDYEVQNESIKNKDTGSEFIFKGFSRNEVEIKSMFGIDICWVEEAQSLSKLSLDVLIPTIRKSRSQIWFSFNRFKTDDPVWEKIFKNPGKRTYCRYINYDENPYFKETELYQDLLDDLEKVKNGEMSQDEFDWIWLGEPFGQDERALIKRRVIMDSINRPFSTKGNVLIPIGSGIKRCGSDPSGLGKDEMVLGMFEEYAVIDSRKDEPETVKLYRELKNQEIKKTVHKQRIGYTVAFIDSDKSILINIDATNMQGYGEDLIDMGYNVNQIHFGGRAKKPELYSDARNEMAFELEEKMRAGHVSLLKCLQREKEMQAYLWDWRKRGKYYQKCLEEKAAFKKREKYSPNYFDMTALALYEPYAPTAFMPFMG